jgi:hypothetical protein
MAPSAAAAAVPPRLCRRRRRRLARLPPLALLLGLAATLAQHLPARAAAQCPIDFTFYPDGTGAINAPSAWSKANQTEAGNTRDDALLPIALYGVPTPRLHASPLSPVLGAPGTPVPDSCATGGAATTRKRRRELLQAGSGRLGGGGPAALLAVPAQFSFSWSLDGKTPRQGQGGPAVNATTGRPIWPSVELGEVWDLADGPHTLALTFVVAAKSGLLSDGTPVPSTDLAATRTVNFYKFTARPTAQVAFGTCQPTFSVGLSGMWPDAVPMTDVAGNVVPSSDAPGSPPMAFLKPVYHLWGRFSAGMDGKAFDGEDNDGSREWHFFDRYYVRELGSPRSLVAERADLVPGYYEASLEGSLATDYPSLVALSGADKFGQDGTVYTSFGADGAFAPTDLLGKDKFNGAFVQGINGTRVGVQRARTALLSISGPDVPPAVGERVEFTWQWLGLGNATCAVDGAPRGNVPDAAAKGLPANACASPYAVTVPDARNHTLTVTMVDVCGARRTETITFAAERPWSTDAVLDGLAMVDSALPLQDPMMLGAGGQGQFLMQGLGGGGSLAGARGRNGAGPAGAGPSAAASALSLALGGAVALVLAVAL